VKRFSFPQSSFKINDVKLNTLSWSQSGHLGMVVFLVLALVGCRTRRDEGLGRVAEERASMATHPDSEKLLRKDARVKVVLSHEPQPFSFRTDLLTSQTNLQAFIHSLKTNGVKDIILESKLKLMSQDRQLYMTAFGAAGIKVGEFWVPIASRPGPSESLGQIVTSLRQQPENRCGKHFASAND
jgi:hypothetical protein